MRGRRTSFAHAACPMARALGLVGDPWSLLIVRDALRGTRRFGEFHKSLGCAKNILTDRLRKLVACGVLAKEAAQRRRDEYALTAKGERLATVLIALAQWGGSYAFAPDETPPRIVDRQDRRPVRPMRARAEDGRELNSRDVLVLPGA